MNYLAISSNYTYSNGNMAVGYKHNFSKMQSIRNHSQKWPKMRYACNAILWCIIKVHFNYENDLPQTWNSHTAYLCQLGSTHVVKKIHVIHFKKLFDHFSCDTNIIKPYRPTGQATWGVRLWYETFAVSCLTAHKLGIIPKW